MTYLWLGKVVELLGVLLTGVVYYFGVGLTWLLSVLVGKKFIRENYEESSFVKVKRSGQLDKMY